MYIYIVIYDQEGEVQFDMWIDWYTTYLVCIYRHDNHLEFVEVQSDR